MSDNIPFEIQVEIMKRVPTKSLFQFRSVSKPWKSLIDSSEFIADYHTHQHHNHHLLVRYDDNSDDLKYVSMVDNDNDNDSFTQHKFPLTVPESVKLINKPKLVGSSHGLFCFYNFYGNNRLDDAVPHTVVVWNPSIRKSVDIDVFDMSSWPCETVIGFGVFPHTLHFKLLKVSFIRFALEIENASDIPYQVEVFTGGGWRSPLCMNNLPRKSIAFEPDQVEIDGFIYWHAYDRSSFDDTGVVFSYRNLIMSFDMTGEEFIEIYLPDGLARFDSYDLFISKLKESLVVLECNMVADKLVYGVWEMEHGISKTFTKVYTISTPEASIERVLGFRKSGEPIVGAYIDSEGCSELDFEQIAIFVYEPDSKHINNVGISGKRVSLFASSYVETLLLFDH